MDVVQYVSIVMYQLESLIFTLTTNIQSIEIDLTVTICYNKEVLPRGVLRSMLMIETLDHDDVCLQYHPS